MNHEQLKTAIAKRINGVVKPADIDRVLLAAADILTRELWLGNKVTLKDIGTFTTLEMPERMGTNPQTGEKMLILAGKRVKLKPCVALKTGVNRGVM